MQNNKVVHTSYSYKSMFDKEPEARMTESRPQRKEGESVFRFEGVKGATPGTGVTNVTTQPVQKTSFAADVDAQTILSAYQRRREDAQAAANREQDARLRLLNLACC